MKRIVLLLTLAVVGLVSSCSSLTDQSSAQAEVFNGKDLTGWKSVLADPNVPADKVWSVEEGSIVCQGEPMGYLQTERSYTNFRLELEYQWPAGKEPGNSGIFSRINGPSKALPRCIEAQLKHGDAGDLFGLQGMSISGDPTRSKKILNHAIGGDINIVSKMIANEKKPGEWNQVRLLVDGPRVTVWLNGQVVNQANGVEVIAGPVALQSEGGEVHFRNIHLVPLP